jgi:DNA-binding LytR/AlgR family response regulator
MTRSGLTLLAIDDEQPQLEDLARLLRGSPAVEEVECASDARDALLKASHGGFDAVFIDFRMPELDGLELARVLKRFSDPPQLVFVSAYDHAAVDAFELKALDYVRKPVSKRRVEEALHRVRDAIDTNGTRDTLAAASPTAPADGELVAVASIRGGGARLIKRSSILYAEAHGDYVRIVTGEDRHLLRATLAEIERRWAPHDFVRVHRQYVANLGRAIELRPRLGSGADLMFADGHQVPVARRHLPSLRERLEL